ncbi:SusC/RagA family TonB-linked outer membrane protein [Sinomicrobium weinanense]|uniref:SusC/RagA family TonB-linked outer membrane protein n=1 Tax=Sinomicrobium weinanense TaxID=2842200 RepID=A0A926JV41_9FLAO|nr:SusC/RagA family TonB-linked outer membrane protein [Sinomicrobium weinanense]MBC9797763.1 SusC/RagA family TonB-linked outer membrane protein [Sinomicrobium weinanense]MBU3122418.1 SusC/RagA family TonB-linked outer membrane protein [Sinomicrobium weinanense]
MKAKKIRCLGLLLLAGTLPGRGMETAEEVSRIERTVRIMQQTVKGVVTDEQGIPLPGATVLIKGTKQGEVTDFDGNFSIEAAPGNVLVITYVGYEPREVTVSDQTDIKVVLKSTDTRLDEVVVTALGIKKEKRKVGYAVQEVKGESLQKAIAPNVVESLTGKVAGLTVTNSNDFFSDPGIFLRGKEPLIVIDGVPTDTDMWNISPDDIESISVLKAASASALYGSRGINGAVQITLKSGASAPEGVTVSVNSSTTFQGGFIRIPKVQNEYGPGNAGKYSFGTGSAGGGGINDFDYSIWGPKFDGRLVAQYDSPIDPETGERIPTPWVARSTNNLKHFMETGLVSSTNVTVQSNGEKGSLLISNTYKHSKASLPGAKLDINVTRIRGLINMSDKVSLEGSLQYDYQYSDNRPRASYGPHSPIYTLAIWGGAHFDVRDFKHVWEPGKEGIRQDFVEHWRYNNPYAMAHAWKKPYTKHDVLGYLKLNYKISDKVNAYIRTNLNVWARTDDEEIAVDLYDYDIPDRGGRYRHSEDNLFESNTDFLITYNDKFFNDDFSIDATLGGNQRFYRYNSSYATTTQLVVPGVFKLDNSVDKVTPESEKFKKGVYSGYASVDLAYKNWFYFGVTGRVDKSSTLPEKNDTFFYPSVYFSTVLSDIFNLPETIDFLKLRTAYAKVGGDIDIYDAVNSYDTGDRYRNLPIATYPDIIDNPDLEPSFNTSYEYGIEAKFFNNRFGFDFSYYENNYGPGIFNQRFSRASGYEGIRLNGRTTQRKGIDFSVNATPVRTDNFSWDLLFNFDRGRDYLTSLPPLPDGTPQEREGRTPVGGRLYNYWYSDWERSPDGQLVIQENGLPKTTDTDRLIGNTQSDFIASVNNTLTYKNISLNFLLDGRFGGITYDRYERDLWRSGAHPDAVHPERELSNMAYANGENAKTMQIPGVKIVSGEIAYDPEGNVLSDTREFAPSDYKVDYQTWATGYKAAWQNNVIEKTFIKLREVSLTYTFPSSLLEKTFFDRASISLIGRNLWYWTKDDTYGDLDTYTMSTGDTDLQMPSQRTYGFNINLHF